MCVCVPYVLFLFPSSYTASSIRLHTYVNGRTIKRGSTVTSGYAIPRKRPFCCAEWCPLVALEACLMVRPSTYVCRRLEEVVYLERKRKRFLSRYTSSSIHLHTYVHGRTIKRASTVTSGHHSAQENEIFLWKSVSSSRCGSSLNGTSVDVRM